MLRELASDLNLFFRKTRSKKGPWAIEPMDPEVCNYLYFFNRQFWSMEQDEGEQNGNDKPIDRKWRECKATQQS